jgi:hypothetical protein
MTGIYQNRFRRNLEKKRLGHYICKKIHKEKDL